MISNPSNWGIPVPLQEFEDQVINVWFEMLPGHIQTTAVVEGHDEEKTEQWWSESADVRLVQFFGFDNSIYYVIYHTAMLLAHGEYRLADTFINNEFYLLDNKKFSTSRKHAIWGSEFFNESNSDWLRYHLCLTGPEFEQTNFSVTEFEQTLEGETLKKWRSLCEKALTVLEESQSSVAPPGEQTGQWLDQYNEQFLRCYGTEQFSLRQAAVTLASYVTEGSERVTESSNVNDVHAILRGLCLFSLPITPRFSGKLHALLYGEQKDHVWELSPQVIPIIDLAQKNDVLASFSPVLLENR